MESSKTKTEDLYKLCQVAITLASPSFEYLYSLS